MGQTAKRLSSYRALLSTVFLVPLFVLTAINAVAADGADQTRPRVVGGGIKTTPAPASNPQEVTDSRAAVASAAFADALKPAAAEAPTGTLAKVAFWNGTASVPGGMPLPAPVPAPKPAASTAPMTPGEKFHYFFKSSFLSLGAYGQSIFTGVVGEWRDDNHHHHASPKDFWADAGSRAGRSVFTRITANFLEKFSLATVLRQDPRYHRSTNKGFGSKTMYAITRVFVTQGDRCGCDQFNFSYLGGGLAAMAISNAWQHSDSQSVGDVFNRWGAHVIFTMLNNMAKEFLGGQ